MPGPTVPEAPKAPPPKTGDPKKLVGGLSERRKQFRESKGVSDETVKKSEAPKESDTEILKDISDDVDSVIADSGKATGENPDIAREVLMQIASLKTTDFLGSRIARLGKRVEKGEATKQEKQDLKSLERKQKKAQQAEAKLRVRAEKLKLDGATPEEKALGFDVEIALTQRDLARSKDTLTKIQADATKTADPESKKTITEAASALERNIKESEVTLKARQKERADATDLPNQVEGLAEALGGAPLSPTERANPLGKVEEMVGEAIMTKDGQAKLQGALIESGIIQDESQLGDFYGTLQGEDIKDTDYKHMAMLAGKGAGLFVLLMAWIAAKSLRGGQGHPG